MKNIFCAVLFVLSTAVFADVVLPFSCWNTAVRAKLSPGKEYLQMEITGKGSRLHYRGKTIDAASGDMLEIIYSAKGFSGETTGSIYFRSENQKLDESRRLRDVKFIADGKKQVMRLTLPPSWRNNGTISEIRLDPAYQTGKGVIFFHSIKIVDMGGTVCWNADNGFRSWHVEKNGKAVISGKNLCITAESAAPRLINRSLNIDSNSCDTLSIRYRITGSVKGRHGSVFFFGPGEKNFSEARRVSIYHFRNDGKWFTHTVKLPPSWNKSKKISALRIDLGLVKGGKIEIESISLSRTVEIASEPEIVWPDVKANLPARKPARLPQPYWRARLIGAPGDDGSVSRNFSVRQKFTVPENLEFAQLQITADDRYTLWVNGKLLDKRMHNHFWGESMCYDITRLVKPGKENVVAAVYRNVSGPGGILFEIGLLTKNGKKSFVCSGKETRCSSVPQGTGWTAADFNDTAWKAPEKINLPPPHPPWSRIIPYQPLVKPLPMKLLSVDIPRFGDAGKTLDVKLNYSAGNVPAQKARVRLLSLPYRIHLEEIAAMTAGKGKTVVLPVKLPRWYSAVKMAIEIEIPGQRKITGEFQYRPRPDKDPKLPVTVKKTADGPQVMIGGKPAYMLCGNVHISEHQENSRLHEVPVNFRTCYIRPNTDRNCWIRGVNGEYDFAVVDRFVESKLIIDPNVKLIFYIDMSMPRALAPHFKDDIVRLSNGKEVPDSVLCVSFASRKFRDVATKALKAFVRHVENSPYASKVGGLLICSGETLEWQYWGGRRAYAQTAIPDYSKVYKEAFKKQHGFELPSAKERFAASREILLDPAKHSKFIAANAFTSQMISETIIEFAAAAKKAMTVPKLVGVYFGYHFTFSSIAWRQQISGHNRERMVLDSGLIDFFLSPPSYNQRRLGDPGSDMKPYTSVRQAGALPIVDDDTRTHMIPAAGYGQTVTPEQTKSIMRRNLGNYLCRVEGCWLLPLRGGREFDSDQTIADLKVFKRASEYQMKQKNVLNSEVVVVVDEQSYDYLSFLRGTFRSEKAGYYTPEGKARTVTTHTLPLIGELISGQLGRLIRSGVPFDCILSSDIGKNIGKYKVWLFLDVFRYDAKLLADVKKLRGTPSVLVWFYAPGLIYGKTADVKNMEKLTGFRFRRIGSGSPQVELLRKNKANLLMGLPEKIAPRFAVETPDAQVMGRYHDTGENAIAMRKDGFSENWFFGGNHVPVSVLREFFRSCGVHVYSDSSDPLMANRLFVSFHTRFPGKKTIRLPEKKTVTDLFTGKVIARDVKEFSFNAALHESRIFFLGTPEQLSAK